MDTSGKGGVLRHTVGLVDPQGVKITSFKAPTAEERKHQFLWRIRKAVPEPGYVGVFDRSHYEDVLIVRVHGLAEPATIESRYDQINEFEAELAADGVVIIKCMLHVVGRRAARPAAGPARQRGQVLEVQPRRHRRARALGRVPDGLRDRAGAHQHRDRAVVRRTGRQEVVPQPGRRRAPARARCAGWRCAGRRRTSTSRSSGAGCSTRCRRRDRDRGGHPLRHPAARGREPARAGRGRRPRHLRLQVPRRRSGRAGAGRGGDRERARHPVGPAHAPAGGARPRPADRPLRGRRGGAGPPQRQPGAQPRASTSCRALSATRGRRPRRPTSPRASSGSTPSPPTSTAPGATPTSCCGTTTSG